MVCGCEDNNVYFVDTETGEADEARTLKGHREVRIITIVYHQSNLLMQIFYLYYITLITYYIS